MDYLKLKLQGIHWENPVKVLQPKKKTTTYGLKSISYTGAKLWNDLFPILSNNVELDVFKASLKIF